MSNALVPQPGRSLAHVGQIANDYAQVGAFEDYLSRKADNTIRHQAADLACFAKFLARLGIVAGDLQYDPAAWSGVTYGLVKGFVGWQLEQGAALGTLNLRLSTVKTYAGLAFQAGTIDEKEHAMIRTVRGYSRKEGKRIDDRRETTRTGRKKAQNTPITVDQAGQLKTQPDTPQGRRDAVIMCLLLDHGLRVGEVHLLQVTDFNLTTGEMTFYRPKVDKVQTHTLTADTARALAAWFASGDAPAVGPLLRASRKGGALGNAGMSTVSIRERVRALGLALGIDALSAHDCRHYWASYWGQRVDRLPRGLFQLQEAGGWNSLAMPRRYVEEGKIANEGMS